MRDTDNSNELINWIEEAISKMHINSYEYKHFSNFQGIVSETFGIIYRANWENSEHYVVLKSFFNLNNATVKNIVVEVITKK